MSIARRIHRPVIACVLACGLLGSTAEARQSQPQANTTAAELAGPLLNERTADITPAELAGQALAADGFSATAPATHAGATRVEPTATGFDPGSAGIGAGAAATLVLIAAGGVGVARRARIRPAR